MTDAPVNTPIGYSVNAANVQDFVRQLTELRDTAGLQFTKLSDFICDCKCDREVVQEKLNLHQQLDDYHELVSVQNELSTCLGKQMRMLLTLANKITHFSKLMNDYVTLDGNDDGGDMDLQPDTIPPTPNETVMEGTKGKKKNKRPAHLAVSSTGKKTKIFE